MADERLAGRADEDRPAQGRKLAQPGDQGEVLLCGLGEADPGIDDRERRVDPRVLCPREPVRKLCPDVGHDVAVSEVLRVGLHRPGRSAHVHEDDGDARARRDVPHPGIAREGRHVVNDRRAGGKRRLCDDSFRCVDRDGHGQAGCQRLDDGNDPPNFFLGGDFGGAGAGRFPAHVDDVRALLDHPLARPHGGVGGRVSPPVGERVRSDVQDPHHQGTGGEVEAPAAPGEDERRQAGAGAGSSDETPAAGRVDARVMTSSIWAESSVSRSRRSSARALRTWKCSFRSDLARS